MCTLFCLSKVCVHVLQDMINITFTDTQINIIFLIKHSIKMVIFHIYNVFCKSFIKDTFYFSSDPLFNNTSKLNKVANSLHKCAKGFLSRFVKCLNNLKSIFTLQTKSIEICELSVDRFTYSH